DVRGRDGDYDGYTGPEIGRRQTELHASANRLIGAFRHRVDQIGLPDELGDEARAWRLEELLRGADLDDAARLEHGHAIGDHHGLRLIVGHVEGGDPERLVETADLEPHLLTERR